MNLYIETENGVTKNHPALESNLIQAFGSVPTHWMPFTRVECPKLGPYQMLATEEPTYIQVGEVFTDAWLLRDMTAEEKIAKQQAVRDASNSREQASNWSAWVLDEATCEMVPPIPRPAADETKIAAGIRTFWCGADANWKDTPVRPEGGYKFDFFAWQWVALWAK